MMQMSENPAERLLLQKNLLLGLIILGLPGQVAPEADKSCEF
jgi:hypothetical protein